MKFKIYKDHLGVFEAHDEKGKYIACAMDEEKLPDAIRAKLEGNIFIKEIDLDIEEKKND